MAIIKYAVLHAMLTTLYIICIASFLFYVPKMFGLDKEPDTVLAPIVMLSLLVFSVATVGTLIFGRPILWYLDGKKHESVSLLVATLASFFLSTVFVACVLLL